MAKARMSRLEYEIWCFDHDYDPVEVKRRVHKRVEGAVTPEKVKGEEKVCV